MTRLSVFPNQFLSGLLIVLKCWQQFRGTFGYHLSFTNQRHEPSPQDVTETITSVNASWQKIKAEKDTAQMNSLPKKLRTVVAADFNILEWSNDETKILYQASESASIPLIINPALIGTDSTSQVATLKKARFMFMILKKTATI